MLVNKPGESHVTEDEFLFHATAVLATGGMVLSGDRLVDLPPERLALLHRPATTPTGAAARRR